MVSILEVWRRWWCSPEKCREAYGREVDITVGAHGGRQRAGAVKVKEAGKRVVCVVCEETTLRTFFGSEVGVLDGDV